MLYQLQKTDKGHVFTDKVRLAPGSGGWLFGRLSPCWKNLVNAPFHTFSTRHPKAFWIDSIWTISDYHPDVILWSMIIVWRSAYHLTINDHWQTQQGKFTPTIPAPMSKVISMYKTGLRKSCSSELWRWRRWAQFQHSQTGPEGTSVQFLLCY